MSLQPTNEPIVMRSEAKSRSNEKKPLISVVIPCMNEEQVIRETCRRLIAALSGADFQFELIFVDDGSKDGTPEILRGLQLDDPRIRVVRLSRNFGHQVAITAGLEHAAGDAVAVIDADLQDPPEVLLEFFAKWLDGYDVVYGVRTERQGETAFKLWTAKSLLSIDRQARRHGDPFGHRRLSSDGPLCGRCIAIHAGARPLCARNGQLAGIFPDFRALPARGPLCRRNEVSIVQNDEVRHGWNCFLFDSAVTTGHLDWIFGLGFVRRGNHRRVAGTLFWSAGIGARLVQYRDRRAFYWRGTTGVHGHHRGIRGKDLRRDETPSVVCSP